MHLRSYCNRGKNKAVLQVYQLLPKSLGPLPTKLNGLTKQSQVNERKSKKNKECAVDLGRASKRPDSERSEAAPTQYVILQHLQHTKLKDKVLNIDLLQNTPWTFELVSCFRIKQVYNSCDLVIQFWSCYIITIAVSIVTQ